ncbi:MAG: glycoside hydrolase family 55 protein [Oscillospiraceae bacterium]|nr:glycoside hydrolase family 55 protein [Oscillospiraceae bacterium]
MKHTLKTAMFIAAIFVFAVFASATASGAYAPLPQEPQLIAGNDEYCDDLTVADIVLTEYPYSADSTGASDSTALIQQALNDCYAAGGGTVYLPTGFYKVTSPIKIPAFCTLRGEYIDPDKADGYGTVILALAPTSEALSPGLFNIGGSAGAYGLTVYYPEQDINDVKPYPYTFFVPGGSGINPADFMLQSVLNCTVINGYRGIGVCVPDGGHEMFTVENFKGTFLKDGATVMNQSDVGTWKNVFISPKYWAEAENKSAAFASPSYDKISAYTLANTIGITAAVLEWTQFANIYIEDCYTGVFIDDGPRIEFAGIFYDTYIKNCVIGMQIDEIDPRWGVAIARSSIEGTQYSILKNYKKGYVKMSDVELMGKTKGSGLVCYDVGLSGYELDYSLIKHQPAENFFIVDAVNDRSVDVSADIQMKLDEAETAGGGIVYIPAGRYLVANPITVPAGVELRGTGTSPTRDQLVTSLGTLIYADFGFAATEAEADTAEALVTLAGDGAGIRGIRFFYPNNPYYDTTVKPCSFTIRGAAADVYAVNICMVGSYNGIDFRGCDSHHIKKLVGVWYRNMMSVGGKNGIVEGCLNNGNITQRNDFDTPGWPTNEGEILFPSLMNVVTRIYTEILRIYESDGQIVYNTFAYGVKNLVINNGGENAALINIGADNINETAPMLITKDGSLTAINMMRYNGSSFVNYGTDLKLYNRMSINIKYEPTVDGSPWSNFMVWLAGIMNSLNTFFTRLFN